MEEIIARYDQIVQAIEALSPAAWEALVWKVRWGGIVNLLGGLCGFAIVAGFLTWVVNIFKKPSGVNWNDQTGFFIGMGLIVGGVASLIVAIASAVGFFNGIHQIGAAEGIVITGLLP